MIGMAQALSSRSGALVVAVTVSSWPSADGCWLGGEPMGQAAARLFDGDRAALTASARAAGYAGMLPRPFVLAGHSLGGALALVTAGYAATSPDLRAVVGLDAGGYPDQTVPALAKLPAAVPVLQIASPAGRSPAGVTGPLLAARAGQFVGVEVVNGCHLDASGDWFWSLILTGCWLRTENVEAVRTVASDWVRNALTGSHDGLTGGAAGQRVVVGAATVIVLPTG